MLVKSSVKYIQSLGHKKSRDEEGVFIAEGPKIVRELLEAGNAEIKEIYALKEWIIENAKLITNIEVIEITEAELERISQLSTPNKLLAIVKKFNANEKITTKGKITLVLDTIQDRGNLGSIIRTADWFGVEQIVCSKDCADVYNPKVVQSTMGSIARVKVIYTHLEEWLAAQKDIRIFATVLDGKNITTIKKISEGIILIGNESKGISTELLKMADIKLTIPKKGKAESLNVAVAVGVVLGFIT